jgi:hypothetical protein
MVRLFGSRASKQNNYTTINPWDTVAKTQVTNGKCEMYNALLLSHALDHFGVVVG